MKGQTKPDDTGDGDDFLKRFVMPYEDWITFSSAPWSGGYRWFRSPNVVPIERYRRVEPCRDARRKR